MNTRPEKEDESFFVTLLKEEARDILWKVGSDTDPVKFINGVLGDLQAVAPREDGLEERSEQEIWLQLRQVLLKAAYATRPYCIRCGTCCTKGSPTLLVGDIDLLKKDILKPYHLTTIRKGELAYSNETEEVAPAASEMIKIREGRDSRTCIFFQKAGSSCTIYENRPFQCRLQECWSPEPSGELNGERLTREDILKAAGSMWDVIQRHEERCSHENLRRAMARLSSTKGQTVDEILEMLRYDHHVREFILKTFKLDPEVLSFFFGRPLKGYLGAYGLRLDEKEDGFLLTMV